MAYITARHLKGFRDSLPAQEAQRQLLITKIKTVFQKFGLASIDTPILEYSEVLLGKGSGETDKQLYRFKDNGGRDVAMRFDLTIPLARFVCEHKSELSFPFKRYHIAKVWRGEKSQKGRYREFYQCDFDIVGSTSFSSDIEILLLVYELFQALELPHFQIEINHRALLNELLNELGLASQSLELTTSLLRLIDKSEKITEQEFLSELNTLVPEEKRQQAILTFLKPQDDFSAALKHLESLLPASPTLIYLQQLLQLLTELKMEKNFKLNPRITRGLDYYTGLVFETFITDKREFGSVCSGGRYDNLTQLFAKDALPGIGGSVGLDRLLALLEESEIAPSPTADVILFQPEKYDEPAETAIIKMATQLRKEGIKCYMTLNNKKWQQQFKLADNNHIKYAIIRESGEKWTLKNLLTRENTSFAQYEEILPQLKREDRC